MHTEVKAAAQFLSSLPKATALSQDQRKIFQEALVDLMLEKFRAHWNQENPIQGNGYRSIIVCDRTIDPIILEAGRRAQISNITDLMPGELYLWVDPFDVCYKYGEYGPVTTIYRADNPHFHGNIFNSIKESVGNSKLVVTVN